MAKPISYQVVKGARDLIADKSRWCQGTFAATKWLGLSRSSHDEDAYRFCAAGAINRTSAALIQGETDACRVSSDAMNDIFKTTGMHPMAVNDSRLLSSKDAHQAVLDLFDRYLASVDEKVEA